MVALAALVVLGLAARALSGAREPPASSLAASPSPSALMPSSAGSLRGGDQDATTTLMAARATSRKLPAKVLSVAEVQALARGKEGWTCEEVVQAYVQRLRGKTAKTYKAVVEVRASEDILMETKSRDVNGALYCVPVIVKDNVDVQGMVSAAGSIAVESMRQPAQAHAPAVARLVEAGAVVLGHANMDEFALGFRTSSSRGGQTLNAFDKSRYPGGSSGGTAVAVALGLAVIGVGTDTGGSVRIPSSFAGLFGIRPTTGGVPVEGVVPLSHSRDTVGFMAATAQDVATSWAIASGQPWCVATAPRDAPRRIGVLPMLLPSESGLGRAFADATTSRAAQTGSGSVFVALAEDAALEEVSRLVAQLSKQKSTSYFEFQDDLRKATGLELASIAAVTAGPCEERLPPSECASVVSTMQKKVHGKLRKREVEMYDLLTRTFPALFEAALTALMRAQRLDALAYPTFKKLPSRISSGKQQYCANNRLAPSVGWPALTLPLATYERLPQGVEVMVPKGKECLLFEIAASLSA